MNWYRKLGDLRDEELVDLIAPLSTVTLGSVLSSKLHGDLESRLEAVRQAMRSWPHSRLTEELRRVLCERAGLNGSNHGSSERQREVLVAAAHGAGVRITKTMSDGDTEAAIAASVGQELADHLQSQGISEDELTARVRDRLSPAQWQTLQESLGGDKVTADAIRRITATSAAGVGAATAINAAGFGAYTALATAIASIAGAAGLTFPFGAYIAASSTLSFLTGPAGFILLPVLGGYHWRRGNRRLSQKLIASTIAILYFHPGTETGESSDI